MSKDKGKKKQPPKVLSGSSAPNTQGHVAGPSLARILELLTGRKSK